MAGWVIGHGEIVFKGYSLSITYLNIASDSLDNNDVRQLRSLLMSLMSLHHHEKKVGKNFMKELLQRY